MIGQIHGLKEMTSYKMPSGYNECARKKKKKKQNKTNKKNKANQKPQVRQDTKT